MKNILHISDLHLSVNKSYGFHESQARKTVNYILEDLESLKKDSNFSIDTIFFTGDISFSGRQEEFQSFQEAFLTPLLAGLGLNSDSVFMVPGNHDMNRSAIKIAEKPLRNEFTNDQLSEIFSGLDKNQEVWPRSEEYNKYTTSTFNKKNIEHNGALCKVFKISNKLFVMCINSAWLAQDDSDHSNLRITESQLKILDRVKFPQDAKIIGLVHHPLDWLEDTDRNIFSTFIEKKISMLCYGHMHDFQQKQENNFNEGITLFLQAGTLDTREAQSGYSLILFNNTNSVDDGRIIYRKFDQKLESYVPWTERGNGGEFNYSTNTMINFDVSKFASVSSSMLNDVDTDLLINIGIANEKKKKLRTLFTEPNYVEDDSVPLDKIKINTTRDIINNNDNIIVFGAHSSGKTSLLKYMFIKGLEKQTYKIIDSIHFYIDCIKDDLSNTHKISRTLCNSYFSAELSTSFEDKIKSMIENGNCTIFIDNIDYLKREKLKPLLDYMKENSACRYIVSCDKNNNTEIITNLLKQGHDNFKTISIGSLRRCNVRDIVSRWEFAIQYSGENKLYNEITKTINNSQLPHNYFIYSMLLAIFEVDPDIKGILSESDIIENFIEILLKKHIMTTPSDKPQYKELLHFLGYFGKHCFENEKTFFSNNEVLELAINFNKKTLSNYNIQDFIDPLVQSGILTLNKNEITFSQPSFMYYAISYFMKHDDGLKNKILSPENYLILDKVVEYYASQNASSLELLKILQERTKLIIDEMSSTIKEEKNTDVNQLDINSMKRISILDLISSREDVETYVEKLKADKIANDNHLDEVAPLNPEGQNCEINIEEEDNKIGLPNILLQNLSLYSRVFRNTELTMDPEKTIDIFDDITEGYIFYMKSFILMMDESYVIPYILPALENKMAEDNLSEREKEKVIELFKTVLSLVRSAMPNNIQMVMTDVISSKKPRIENIIKATREKTTDEVKNAILGYVLMDIKDENIIPLVNELSKVKNNVVQESLFFKINHAIISNYDLPRKDIENLKNILRKIATEKKMTNISTIGRAMSAINDDGIIK